MSQTTKKKRQDRVSTRGQEDTSKLHSLCEDGNVDGVQNYMEKLRDEEVASKLSTRKGVFGYTPLHLAAAGGRTKVLKYLLTKIDDKHKSQLVNCKANSGYTPLHLAASNGHKECIKALLQHGADIAAEDEYNKTPQQSAELSFKASIVRLLRSEEIIKEVETNGDNLTELLQQDLEQLEPDCMPRALKAATLNDNPVAIGKLVVKGANNIEECIRIAITERKHRSRGMLLLVKAAMTGNKSMVQKLFRDSNVSNPNCLPSEQFNDQEFHEVQKAVSEKKVSTVVPIDIARKNGHGAAREELLIKTDVCEADGTVFWHGLRLLSLEVSWLRRINWVKRLRLARNGLKKLPQEIGSYLKQVVKLDLQHNELTEIPCCILELPSLGELNLAHNLLTEIPDVVEWSPCLTVLELSHNHISGLPSNVIAPTMRSLNLSHNQLHYVPLSICSFINLQNLNLSYNPGIVQLPSEMGRLSQLSRLQIDGLKDLNDPPRAILNKDAQHCIRYLNSKLRCAKGFYKMKLMLVGQANRGKTTLVARLQGKDCGNESTVGVDVSEWSYKPNLGKNKFYFSIWDFGGQEEYYATHQCFLSERSLYLLLFNLKHGEEGVQELKPWLNNIALRAPNSLVIIVGTHLDEVNDDERTEVDHILQCAGKVANRFTNKLTIAQILPVGLTGRIENIGLLKNAIYNHAAKYKVQKGPPIMGRKIPASYHALDKRLECLQVELWQAKRDPVMDSEQFKKMVFNLKLPDLNDSEELKTATLFLTDVGSLLHYDDRSHNLNELYFVDPRWLCDMMSKIVTIKEKNPYIKNGILHSKNLPFLFRDERFPWKHFEQYLTLLDRFEIALPLDNKRLLIPSMLPQTSPQKERTDEVLYTRYIIFPKHNATPPGFWSRLLSRMMHSVQIIVVAMNIIAEAALEESVEDSFKNTVSQGQPIDTTTLSDSKEDLPAEVDTFEADTIDDLTAKGNQERSICRPIPGIEGDVPLILPHFPTQLPINLQPCYSKKDITLHYWREGLFYKDPAVMFQIESFSSHKKLGDGVVLQASPTNEGKKIIGQLVDIVLSLIQEWYPGLNDSSHGTGIEQKVPCIECMIEGRSRPFEFQVEQCLKAISNCETSILCGYMTAQAQNHLVALAEIVPDLLLQDIDLKFLLKKEDIIYEETKNNLLGTGGYGKVYRGKCHDRRVAIKKYLSSTDEAFSELRLEAKLLQQSYHPCFVCLVGVCIYPMMALVLELAPCGSLTHPLLKQKKPIHRLTIFRIALEVAAALRFIHNRGIVFRDLKADNVLLWTLDPDSLCHCKITDFGIATHLSPVGVKGLKGTKGFIAPEVLHIDKRKQRSGYDYKADTFSFAMFLYQLIARRHPYHDVAVQRVDSYIENGERPKLADVNMAHFCFTYLTKLMITCWRDNPRSRPEDNMLLCKLCQVTMQSTMAITLVKTDLSLRKAIAITQDDFFEADMNSNNSELWVCCDGPDGSEVNVYNTHSMAKISRVPIEDNQVHSVIKCCNHVWIGFRTGIECSVVNVFSIKTRELVHSIRMRDISVSCMTCTNENVYVGTVEGFCFQFPSTIDKVRSVEKPLHKYISKYAIDGIVATHQCVWISHKNNICFITFEGFKLLGSIKSKTNVQIGELSLSPDGKFVWSAFLKGGSLLSAWDAHENGHLFDIDSRDHMTTISNNIPDKDCIITAMTPALNCVWVGMVTGHILVCHDKELLTWFHPYNEYVRFLAVIHDPGICEAAECMVASGGKHFQSLMEDLDEAIRDDERGQSLLEEEHDTTGGYLVLWEAFSAKAYRQMNLIQNNTPFMFENHENMSAIISEGQFLDGTNILNRDTPIIEDDNDIVGDPYAVDSNAQSYSESSYETQSSASDESGLENSTNTFTAGASDDYATSEVTQSSSGSTNYCGPPITASLTPSRMRTTTIVSMSAQASTHHVFDVKLASTKQIIRITCPSPPQLTVALNHLLANATDIDSEDNCKLVYYSQTKELEIHSQEDFKKYLMLQNKPQLWLVV